MSFLGNRKCIDHEIRDPLPAHLGPLTDKIPTPIQRPYPFGRFKKPSTEVSFGSDETFFQLKRWSFVSLRSKHYFVNFAIANLNYLTNTFLYVVDTRTHKKLVEYSILSPYPVPQLDSFANSSVAGITQWRSGPLETLLGSSLNFTIRGKDGEMSVLLEFRDGRNTVQIHSVASFDEALVMLYPITNTRPVYTHKEVGMKSEGTININNEVEKVEVTSIDWTHGLSRRVTTWKWCCLQALLEDGSTIGVNLSDEVYNDVNGVSQENAIWINHKVIDFPPDLKISWTLNTQDNKWFIIADQQPEFLNLTFTPRGSREEHVHLGIIASDFVQPYGTFEGMVAGKKIYQVYGVVEDHYAKWIPQDVTFKPIANLY